MLAIQNQKLHLKILALASDLMAIALDHLNTYNHAELPLHHITLFNNYHSCLLCCNT